MKRWKKILLIIVAAAVLTGLVLGGIAWSRRGVVAVQIGKVIRQDLASIVTASGEIKPPSNQWANVNANSFGKITEILVKEGDRVKRGQLLLKTESVQQEADVKAQEAALLTARADASAAEAAVASSSANLKTSQADLAQSRARYNQSKDDFNRAEQLFKDRLIAQQVHDQRRSDYAVAQAGLESAQARVTQARAQVEQATYNRDMAKARVAQNQAQLIRAKDLRSKTIYTSPLDGIITSLPVHVGENVVPGIQNQPGSVLFQVSDLSVITAEVKVDETDIVNVKLGQPAEVNIDAIPNKTFKGHVTEIGQSAVSRTTGQTTSQSGASNEEAKDFKVVVTLDDPPSNVRPGLSTTAKVTTATRQNAVTVPIQALTIRTRRELEETGKDAKDKALAAGPGVSTPVASPKDKEKGKEELQGVFAVRKGRAVFVPVETGIMGSTDVEVVKGLEQGEEMVTGSYQVLRTLKNNTKVKVEKNSGDKGPAAPR
ncbi:MAG: secretion protein HlyD [Acidobacteria bacterium]|nr:MAG: secretion protein HlyD [Acidobacteriota bacterium]